MSKCKHNRIKRKLIEQGKGPGTYTAYCSQQCKKVKAITITQKDIDTVYPKGKPKAAR
jgi:hypothetical protein